MCKNVNSDLCWCSQECLSSFSSYEKDDDEKDDLKDDKDVDPGKLDDDSWGGSRGFRHSSRDGRQAPIPTFRAYSSEDFKQRDRECMYLHAWYNIVLCSSLGL